MRTSTKLLAFAAGVVALPLAELNLSGVTITNVIHYGDGCPQGSNIQITTSANSVIAHFPAFDVTIGNNAAQADQSDFCGIGIDVSVPAGLQFSPVSTNYLDSVNVGDGVTGTHLMTYTFSGTTDVAETRRDFVGPVRGDFNNTDAVSGGDRVWSACGSAYTLLITNRGYVTTGGGSGTGTGSFNVGPVQTNLQWRSC